MLLTRTADPVDHRDAAYDETKLRYALNTPVYLPTNPMYPIASRCPSRMFIIPVSYCHNACHPLPFVRW